MLAEERNGELLSEVVEERFYKTDKFRKRRNFSVTHPYEARKRLERP